MFGFKKKVEIHTSEEWEEIWQEEVDWLDKNQAKFEWIKDWLNKNHTPELNQTYLNIWDSSHWDDILTQSEQTYIDKLTWYNDYNNKAQIVEERDAFING